MLEKIVSQFDNPNHPSCPQYDAVESKVWKTVTIHQFPDGVEVFIDEAKRTWSDGAEFDDIDGDKRVERGEGDRERSIDRAARRAKTQVRRRCKMIQADCMMTLTYRANQQDEKRVEADFKAFRKRLETIGKFQYVATLERQEGYMNGNMQAQQGRSSIHVHIACQQFPAYLRNEHGVRVKSYALISSMWSRVIGRGNGNVNFTKPRGRNSAHRIASYIAKYVSKKVSEAALNAKSYWSSKNIEMPKPERIWYDGDTSTYDIVVAIAKQFAVKGYTDIAQYADSMNQFHWFSASSPTS